jgi:predicted nicotinamide N-methyase
MPETPLESLGGIVREEVFIEEKTFLIERPADSERILDHPAIRAAFAVDEYLPYWADLWPAARMMAKAIVREPWSAGQHSVEIGCGLGLPGIAALAAGLRVTFTDVDATALRFAANNAALNGFDQFTTRQIDWRYPPDDLQAHVVIGSDLIFELRNVIPLVQLIKRLLAPGGVCWLTDQDRVPSNALRETLPQQGFEFTTQPMRAGKPGGQRVKGTLYKIRAKLPSVP